MPHYKITIVETAIYDAYVKDAESLEQAKDIALDNRKLWYKDNDASSAELGTDHYEFVDDEWVVVK